MTVATVTGQVTAKWQYWTWPVTMVTTHKHSLHMWLFRILWNPLEMEKDDQFHIMILFYRLKWNVYFE